MSTHVSFIGLELGVSYINKKNVEGCSQPVLVARIKLRARSGRDIVATCILCCIADDDDGGIVLSCINCRPVHSADNHPVRRTTNFRTNAFLLSEVYRFRGRTLQQQIEQTTRGGQSPQGGQGTTQTEKRKKEKQKKKKGTLELWHQTKEGSGGYYIARINNT